MSTPPPAASYRDIAGSLQPAAVSRYLAATGDWVLEARQDGVREVWALPAQSASSARGQASRARIMLPLDREFVDFGQHFEDALGALATVNEWSSLQLEREILGIHADRLLVKLDQAHIGDSIPLKQAETTIDAIYKMLRAAALITATPNQTFKGGRLPAPVTSFLEDDVRLGHTQRGSFIFTVVARLDPPDSPGNTPQADRSARQFSRKVMENLALGIATTRDLARGQGPAALSDPAQWGLSAGLVESLEDITAAEGLHAVDLSFEWAAAEAPPEVGNDTVRLDHEILGQMARIREQLLRAEESVRRETLIGPVVSLSREDEGPFDDEAASVIISAEVNGRRRNVHAILTGRRHELAIQAYQLKVPIVVTGDLIFVRRAWRLEGNVEVDEDILVRRIAESRGAP
jgi:hypothetical protein